MLLGASMGTTVLKGPVLVTRSGGTASKPPTETVTTTPSFTYTGHSNAQKRAKPNNVLLAATTSYGKSRSAMTRGYAHGAYGNRSLGPVMSSIATPYDVGFALDQDMQFAFLEKVKATTWNVGTFVGELPETLSFFTGAAKALWESYRAVKRGNLKKMRKVLSRWYQRTGIKHVWKKFSDVWLGWRYGVQPLVMETESMLNALADTGLRPHYRRVAVNRTKAWYANGKGAQPSDYTWTQYVNRTARRGAYFEVNPLADKWKRFGALNLLETLWELTPLSFVFDWFIPIGKSIAALDAEAGVSYKNKWKSSLEIQNHALVGPKIDRATWYEKSYSRSANGDSIPFPWYKPHISVVRYFDFLALVRQVGAR